ncbi:MAG: tetratricopeptide repeat protein [Bacteroidota bacterium]|nr:tetratricopeptide repeat protein [Bacteroidota bacterium]
MKKIGTPLIIISLCVLIVVVLFVPGIKTSNKKVPAKSSLNSDAPKLANFDSLELKAAVSLPQDIKKDWEFLHKEMQLTSHDSDKLRTMNSLGMLWNSQRNYGIAGIYSYKIAELKPSFKNWIFTAQSFYAGTLIANSKEEILLYAVKGEQAARKAMALDVESNEAKNLLAEHLIAQDKKSEGMPEYIPLLLQVLKKDSNNVQALYNLGMQAIKSGQLEKAKARFEKLIRLQPSLPDNYSYLADIYVRMGNAKDAVANYEKCLSLTKDPIKAEEIKIKIKEIKH